ncbi:MAG TPA: hypothetical protein VJ814_08840 [Gaiellaceae bacterium]|nr:hypothetical protein [Gaiellaceae bacterium]
MRRWSWLALLLAGVALTGCDVLGKTELKPQPKTLSHAQLVRAANHACARARQRTKRLKTPKSFEQLDRDLNVVIRVQERALFTLRGLAPRPSDAVAYRRILASLNYEDLVIHNFLQAFEQRNVHRLKSLAKRLVKIGKAFNRRARRFGLRACVKT